MNNLRAHASAITTLWIAMGIILLPSYIFLGRGSLDSNDPYQIIFFIAGVGFYIYFFIESIIAAFCIKYIQELKKYIIAVAIIVISPFLLIAGIVGNEYTETNTPFLVSFGVIIGTQLLASIVIWSIIFKK